MDELHVEPLRKPRKRRFNGDQSEDAQGQLVEYEHGYLRHKAKAARGMLPQKRVKCLAFEPQVVTDCGIEILYVLEFGTNPAAIYGDLLVELWWRPVGKNGPLQPVVVSAETTVPGTTDQALLKFLYSMREKQPGSRGNRFLIPQEKQLRLCELLEEAGQVRWSARGSEAVWRLHRLLPVGKCPWFVQWEKNADGARRPRIWIGAPQGDLPCEEWQAMSPAGWVVSGETLCRISVHAAGMRLAGLVGRPMPWMDNVEAREFGELLALDGGADLSRMAASERCEEVSGTPYGNLFVTTARFKHLGQEQLQCKLSFDYDGTLCPEEEAAPRIQGKHQVILRDISAEEELKSQLLRLGFRNVTRQGGDEDPGWKLLPSRLDAAVQALVSSGWVVHAEGKNYRRPTEKTLGVVASGIDWLELSAKVDFGNGVVLGLPELLQIARKGSKAVRLDDGTYGILPTEWLEKFTALVEIGDSDDSRVRFRQEQASLMQALLQEQLQDLDGRYTQVLARLETEAQIGTPEALPPPWFTAVLRPYQRQALRWLTAMERQGLSGILADDMGLGKTVEVLSLLSRRHENHPACPSLVVMPSSLIFNWNAEAAKFAPVLRVGVYYGPGRDASMAWFNQYDVVFTTYGTLRQDAMRLASIPFDYVVLDESQAIKNADSATAQAARVLHGEHRLAMTGTPIENHLAELFSQLTFLNPGLFTQRFTETLGRESGILRDRETAARLRKAVAPFLLRRRKEQVAPELPPKTEQVLWCDLDDLQRARYDELRDFYRREFSQGSTPQAGGSAANMLGALLRLRQAACHAGLVNEAFRQDPSAKLTLLHERLSGLLEAGHKALVFSQFTSLLKIVALDLEGAGWKYCYLDGETKDRASVVKEFQETPEVGVFLISLKAGGVGLNLTAADYVFLLDPWWNPAAEAQAVDRTYRIGQTRPVFAYRMVARNTVEEKVLQMQHRKRQVATAALGRTPGAESPLEMPPGLTAQELRELLE